MSFANGSYLGDNDVLLDLNAPMRSESAFASVESTVYAIKSHRLNDTLEEFDRIRRNMKHVAQ